MCLESKHFFPRFTFKPIKVYKCLIENRRKSLFAPYFPEFRYRCGVKYENSLSFDQILNKKKGSGFFHSFLYFDGALQLKSHLELRKMLDPVRFSDGYVVIYECEIPKFSFYYRNVYNKEICSTKLRVLKRVCF